MKIRTSVKALMVLAGALFLLFNPVSSKADMIFYIESPNQDLSGYAGPYAKVVIDLTSVTTATVQVTTYSNYYIGGARAFDLNLASAATAGSFSWVTAVSGGSPSFTPGYNPVNSVDGFGVLNLQIDNTDGFKDSVTYLSFTLTKSSGSWASESDVLVGNGTPGYFAAAHIFVANLDGSNTGVTGFATVPEPGILILLGISMMSVAGLKRWWKD
jgi:hypothetical protein